RISFCNFDSNRSVRDGGAVSLGTMSDVTIDTSQFKNNLARHDDGGSPDISAGMGGAIASFSSTLTVQDSLFTSNRADVVHGNGIPTPGSAGGGGDIYILNGSFNMRHSRLVDAVAGAFKSRIDP